jgi:hypothetical protein
MANDPEAISRAVAELIQPQARSRLLALGLARGMVWKDGVIPEGAPAPLHAATLTPDLLDFGYGILALALELRDSNRERPEQRQFETEEAFLTAAEAIESAVRRGDHNSSDQGRHLVVSAAAFHLAGYAARSYSLLPVRALDNNLASPERALAYVLRRDLSLLRSHIIQWQSNPEHSDDAISTRLLDPDDEFGPEDAMVVALATSFHSGLGLADTALMFGNSDLFNAAYLAIENVVNLAGQVGNIPMWWVATLTLHLLRDLWDHSLHVTLPAGPNLPAMWVTLRRDFIAQLGTRRPPHVDLWPSQIAAARRATDPSDDLVIALPTSAGKTRIAELCILRALADGKRIIYVTPLRALSAQVERVLARTFVPLGASVTSLYGASGVTMADVKTLMDATIVVATPEKLDFALRQDAAILADVALVVFDEGHMIGLGSREIRYEVLIQRLLRRSDSDQRRIVCLSAMFNPEDPSFKDFGNWLRSDAPGESVHVKWRPTRQRFATLDWSAGSETGRLAFLDGEKPYVPRFVESLAARKPRRNSFPQNDKEFCICAANAFAQDGHTVLVYSPVRSQVEPLAAEFRHIRDQGYFTDLKVPPPERMAVAHAIIREWLGEKHAAARALDAGVGTHHGALPRAFLNVIEELLDARQLSIVVASPTLAQGIDLACSVLVFRSLRRYEGGEWRPIPTAEFANVVGRAGRAYVDLDGIALLPTFDSGSRSEQHAIFQKLIDGSQGQRLISGLAKLIWQISRLLTRRLGVKQADMLEYVLNQKDVWDDPQFQTDFNPDDDEDVTEDDLERHLADLDVAVLSLVEPLDINIQQLADTLDEVLNGSLWKRTLLHLKDSEQKIERALLQSRADWLWRRTTAGQRAACFFSGLGRKPGLFLFEQLDDLIELLALFQQAVFVGDGEAAGEAAVQFAQRAVLEPFFTVRNLPEEWKGALKAWVMGTPLSAILAGRSAKEAQKVQAFIQDGVVFRLVWAAESVRVQANAIEHPRKDEVADGPAFALTYGVPTIAAALLCQAGFASRSGAIWAVTQLSASFSDADGFRTWLRENDAILNDADFWESADHRLLWRQAFAPPVSERPNQWNHKSYRLRPKWMDGNRPEVGSQLRVIPGTGRTATICTSSLVPIATAQLPFDPHNAALSANAIAGEQVRISYFGPN